MTHVLKIYRCFAKYVFEGKKTFEIRKNDRDFKVGDFVHFVDTNGLEFFPSEIFDLHDNDNLYVITFVLHDSDWKDVPIGFCIFSIDRVKQYM